MPSTRTIGLRCAAREIAVILSGLDGSMNSAGFERSDRRSTGLPSSGERGTAKGAFASAKVRSASETS